MSTSAPASANGTTNATGANLTKQPSKRLGRKKLTMSSTSVGKSGTHGDRTVRRLRLIQALTIPASTPVGEACQRMAARRTDAVLLTDENALLCGIATDRDMSLKVVGAGLDPETTLVSAVMTRNPVFVTIDSSAVEALQKMVQGRFRHLPVVEGGEVVAVLDITKCLYDAIARMERAAEKGSAIAAAIEGVERQWGNAPAGGGNHIENFRDKLFRPTLASLLSDQNSLATVSGSDSVSVAAALMRERRVSAVIVSAEDGLRPSGILTSKDVLMRVLAVGKGASATLVSDVMTPNPECVPLHTPIVDALHTMHDGKFLHLPVVDREGRTVACLDVIHLTHGAVASAAGGGAPGSVPTDNMMQQFWDSALALDPADTEDDNHSIRSSDMSEVMGLSMFSYKFEGGGRMHKVTTAADSLADLKAAVGGRVGSESVSALQYEDEDGDRILLQVDEDLQAAVALARAKQMKTLKIHVEYCKAPPPVRMMGGYGTTSLILLTSLTCLTLACIAYQRRVGGGAVIVKAEHL